MRTQNDPHRGHVCSGAIRVLVCGIPVELGDTEQVPLVLLHDGVSVDESLNGQVGQFVFQDDETRGFGTSKPFVHRSVDFLRCCSPASQTPIFGTIGKKRLVT